LSVVRILIWNLADSKTTLEEVREQLPAAGDGDVWIADGGQERFGLCRRRTSCLTFSRCAT